MDLSGIIFVVLALAWAVYLIPKALKHHDEIARTRSVDRFSAAMRVLARREPVSRGEARLVVTPHSPTESLLPTAPSPSAPAPSPSAPAPTPSPSPATARSATAAAPSPDTVSSPGPRGSSPLRPEARRAAARAAAKRRRRILLLLVVADLTTVTVGAIDLVPWWSVAIPASLTLCYLFLCRRQAKRANAVRGARDTSPARPAADRARSTPPRRAARVDAAYGTQRTAGKAHRPQEVSPDEDTIALSVTAVTAALGAPSAAEADAAAARALAADGGSLWDPLPMTLPTYVNKRRAVRTVRTINLDAPGTWTSGRSASDSQLVEDATAAQGEAANPQDEQRAVGS